ncbi:MAG: cation-efflux pump, partial [Thermoleophilia bacterium]|nr:cation-efflux pump [Thermoleophilia bacterium]
GQRPPDRTHPFGHGRAEHLAALFEALLLLAATVYIAYGAIHRLATGADDIDVNAWTIGTIGLVIAIDIWRTTSSHVAAREYDSPALASNALHFASDLAGSVAVLIGLVLVMTGFPAGDSLAALIVAAIVATSAGRLLWDNAQVLMDVAPEGAERAATRAVTNLDLPLTLRRLRIRRSAGQYLADIVIAVDAISHVSQGHAIADSVEEAVQAALPGADVVVHVEPLDSTGSIRDRVTAAALAHPGIHEVHDVRVLLTDGVPEASLHIKVRPDMRLDHAHELAERVERDIRDKVTGISHVDVHIEPVDAEAVEAGAVVDDQLLLIIAAASIELTGHPYVEARLRDAPRGLTAYVTIVARADQSLHDAHELATDVEELIQRRAPSIIDVVVHTEPVYES